MKLFTIVVTYNADQYIKGCFGGLLNSDIEQVIIAVDNASQDSTVERLKSEYPEVILFVQSTNVGFGRANNIGIEYALNHDADYIFLLNQDACVFEDTLSMLISIFNRNSDYGIVSPIHYNGTGKELDYIWKGLYLTTETCPEYFNDLKESCTKEIYEIVFVNAAAWMISANCLRIVGGFNPFFFMYSEDVEFINRLDYNGFKLGFCPDARILHFRDKSEAVSSERTRKFLIRKYYYGSAIQMMDPRKSPLLSFLSISWNSLKRSAGVLKKGWWKESLFHLYIPVRIFFNWFTFRKYRIKSKRFDGPYLNY